MKAYSLLNFSFFSFFKIKSLNPILQVAINDLQQTRSGNVHETTTANTDPACAVLLWLLC